MSHSLACCVSGLEIAENDPCYVVMLRRARYNYWAYEQALPPVRGTYGDSGYLDVADSPEFCAAWGVPPGPDWEVLDHHPDLMPCWIAEPVFDHMPQLPGADDGKPLQPFLLEVMEDARRLVQEQVEMTTSLKELAHDRPDMEDFGEFKDFQFIAGGRNHLRREILPDVGEVMATRLNAGHPAEPVLLGYERALQLHWGSMQLRRPLFPLNGSYGPQFGGSAAMISMTRRVLELAEARLPEDREFWGDGSD